MHFANIDIEFLYEFERLTGIINIITFIKATVYQDYLLYLNGIEDIKELDLLLKKYHYKDKSEWLREKMRMEMNKYIEL